jgi:hypothetical protein
MENTLVWHGTISLKMREGEDMGSALMRLYRLMDENLSVYEEVEYSSNQVEVKRN